MKNLILGLALLMSGGQISAQEDSTSSNYREIQAELNKMSAEMESWSKIIKEELQKKHSTDCAEIEMVKLEISKERKLYDHRSQKELEDWGDNFENSMELWAVDFEKAMEEWGAEMEEWANELEASLKNGDNPPQAPGAPRIPNKK